MKNLHRYAYSRLARQVDIRKACAASADGKQGEPVSSATQTSQVDARAGQSRSLAFAFVSMPRRPLVVMLLALVLLAAFSKRARSSNSRWSLLARVARYEAIALLHQVKKAKPNDRASVAHLKTAPNLAYRLPGEFEPQAGLILSGDLAESYRDVFHQVVDAVPSNMRIITLVQDEDQRDVIRQRLRDRGRRPNDVLLVTAPHDSKWVRDFAPMMLLPKPHTSGSPLLLDFEYLDRSQHLTVNRDLARRMDLDVRHDLMKVEGGNFLSNGEGLCLTSTSLLDANPTLSQHEISRRLRQAFGLDQIAFLERLDGEGTGHVDLFVTFTAPDTVVIGSYGRLSDPENAAILDRNADRLANIQTPRGPLRVVRIPMPSNIDGKWRTYTNVLYANRVLLPVYKRDKKSEQKAVETYSRLLPGWTIARINVDPLIQGGGALHCVAMNLASVGALAAPQPEF